MNRLIIILLFLVTTTQLLSQNKIDLTSDKSLTKVFNKSEINGFKLMIHYVDNLVLNRVNETDINKAYHLFFEEIAQSLEYIVPFKENEKYKFLQSLDSIQFASIWIFSNRQDMISTGDTVYRNLENFKMLHIKPYSKYMCYLKEIGKDDSYFQNLQLEFEGSGNLMQDSSEWFPRNHKNFDFNIPKNRLWAVIYLLRREETTQMKLDRYFKDK